MSVVDLLPLFAIGVVAYVIETALGFGATVVAVSLAAQLITLDQLLPAFVPINVVLSLWILSRGIRLVEWRVLAADIAPAVVVGAAIGMALFHIPARLLLQLLFAVSVILLAGVQLARFGLPPGPAPRPAITRLLFGIGGLAHGLFGTGGPMIVYALSDRIREKGRFRATLAVVWLTMAIALMTNYASMGLYTDDTWQRTAAFGAAIIPGIIIGERLHHRLDPRAFHRFVLLLLLSTSTILAVRTALQLWG